MPHLGKRKTRSEYLGGGNTNNSSANNNNDDMRESGMDNNFNSGGQLNQTQVEGQTCITSYFGG